MLWTSLALGQGTITFSNTTLSSNPYITQSQLDNRLWSVISPAAINIAPANWVFSSGSGGSSTSSQYGTTMNSGTSLGGYGVWTMVSFLYLNHSNGGAGGYNLSFAKPWAMTFNIGRPIVCTNTSLDFRITNQAWNVQPTYTVGNSETACGWKLMPLTTGTATYTGFLAMSGSVAYSTPVTVGADQKLSYVVYCDGAGNVVFYTWDYTTRRYVTIASMTRPTASNLSAKIILSVLNNGVSPERIDASTLGGFTFYDLSLTQ